ncbi:MAG TPA: formyltransferase family protein [Thermoleophilaceae bacterium]|nr:formyltransferase family protein [Thermoleophilaceae bacterium]
MKVIFMGKHKRSAVRALHHLTERDCELAAVVAPPPDVDAHAEQRLDLAAEAAGLPLTNDDDLYRALAEPGDSELELDGTDLVVSFLFWKRILAPLIELPAIACLNFHPAPLPDLRGLGGYNVAIVEGFPEWGVSAHVVDEDLDTGDLVAVDRFPIDPASETALSLDLKSQARLYDLFRSVIDDLLDGRALPRSPQGPGRYVSRAEFEALRRVAPDDPPELVERKVRAFWYPPHPGATIDVGGRTLTLVDEARLRELAMLYRRAGALP